MWFGEAVPDANLKFAPKRETDVALMCLEADEASENAGLLARVIDLSVQTLGQPNPAMTHCELWMAERSTTEDNHFGQYLGQRDSAGELTGSLWTSGLSTSAEFYRKKSWAAIPVFAVEAEKRVRNECDVNVGTPYPSWWTLFDYPWSVWPLRSLAAWFKSDSVSEPAHCAALSARILRNAIPEMSLRHNSYWYGPSSLYLELSTPYQMKRALHLQRPPGVVRSQAEDEEDDALLDTLLYGNDEEVTAMTTAESRKAVHVAAIKVLEAGAGESADDVDQTLFLQAQKQYATAMVRHTWVGRVGRHVRELQAEQASAEAAAAAAEATARERAAEQKAAREAAAAAAAQAEADAAADAAAVAEATARFQAEDERAPLVEEEKAEQAEDAEAE